SIRISRRPFALAGRATKHELVELPDPEHEASRPRERTRECLSNGCRPKRLAFAFGGNVVERVKRRDQIAGDLERGQAVTAKASGALDDAEHRDLRGRPPIDGDRPGALEKPVRGVD